MPFDCTTEDYDRLYARWVQVNPGGLLDLAQYQPGEEVLDLCGGTGAVSRECLRRGASPKTITLVDLNPRNPPLGIRVWQGNANDLSLVFADNQRYNLVVCRQAAAYLDWTPRMVRSLWNTMAKDGRLAFSIFRKPKRFSVKTYLFGGRQFMEASARLGRTVYHLQLSDENILDVTRFRWYKPMELYKVLSPYFHVEWVEDGPSIRFICRKKG